MSDRMEHVRARFVDDLLSYMTLEEKLGQLDLFHSVDDPALEHAIIEGRIGGIAGNSIHRRCQLLATQRTRLGIPLLLAGPTADSPMSPWALAASWDEDLAHAVGALAAANAIADGGNAMRAPCATSDPAARSPDVQIATAEPLLAARLSAAFTRGAGGDGDDHRTSVLAIPAWSSARGYEGGQWARSLIEAGGAVGIDCAGLDHDTALRAGFSGLLVSECRRILDRIDQYFHATSARSTLEAAERMIAEGSISEQEVDAATRGVLTAKHAVGLFRDPARIAPAEAAASRAYAQANQSARGTFVLLRNEAGLLPLSPVSDRVLVVGAADGVGGACADALSRAGIGHSIAPGLAQRREGESWTSAVAGDHFALSLTCDAARRSDFVLVALEDRHFDKAGPSGWPQPSLPTLAMLRGLALGSARLVAILATPTPVDLGDADQHFAAVLNCWEPGAEFVEALSDVLSGRFSPQGRMPTSAGRFLTGHGLGFGETILSGYSLTASPEGVTATIQIRNSGTFAMRETVQVYARGPGGGSHLVDFQHVQLAPGAGATLNFALGLEALGHADDQGRVEIAPGYHEIRIGKSADRLLSATIEVHPALARAIMMGKGDLLRLASG